MKRFILTIGIWGFGLAASLTTPLAQARECGCGDLPVMLNELAQHEYMQKLFQGYADYLPRGIETPGQVKDRAQEQFNAAFYGASAGSVAGTTHGGHAALGTDVYDSSCPILAYLYDKKGNKVLNKDGTQTTEPVTEQTYKTSQCSGRTRADFAHERAHQANCRRLVENNKTKLWDSPAFFAGDDANAYKVGADVLRSEIKTLAGTCGWESSTKNRLPDIDEAMQLAKKAAKARPARRRK